MPGVTDFSSNQGKAVKIEFIIPWHMHFLAKAEIWPDKNCTTEESTAVFKRPMPRMSREWRENLAVT